MGKWGAVDSYIAIYQCSKNGGLLDSCRKGRFLSFSEDDCTRQRGLKGTVAKLAMRQPFVLFKGLTFQKLCLPGAFRPGDHHNKRFFAEAWGKVS